MPLKLLSADTINQLVNPTYHVQVVPSVVNPGLHVLYSLVEN